MMTLSFSVNEEKKRHLAKKGFTEKTNQNCFKVDLIIMKEEFFRSI